MLSIHLKVLSLLSGQIDILTGPDHFLHRRFFYCPGGHGEDGFEHRQHADCLFPAPRRLGLAEKGQGLAERPQFRRLAPQAGWWILASAVGWAVGAAVVTAVFPPQPGVLAGAVLGAMTGLAQWFVLRRWVRQAGWWVLISALGWAIGLIGVLGASLAGAVVGAVTGIALELLLRHPHPNLEM